MKTPERLVRAMEGEIEVDLAGRILERAQIVTRRLAADGGIVLPDGISVRFFEKNPVVLARHGADGDAHSPVIGRSLALARDARGIVSRTQFADTALGREYAYLYGVNEAREVYARGWSFGWTTVEAEFWPLEQARAFLREDWDEELVPAFARKNDEVWVARRSIMHEYSAVALGADKAALSRAWTEKNVRAAAQMLAAVELDEAVALAAALKGEIGAQEARLAKLEADIQALRGEGAAAAVRRDSAALLEELRGLVAIASRKE